MPRARRGRTGALRGMARKSRVSETERVRRIYDKMAPRFDRKIGFWERVLFAGGREWACSHAKGDVLEIGLGTGRNLSFYPEGIRLTGVRSPARIVRWGQRLLEPINVRIEGDHLLREPLDHLRAEEFEIEHLERSKWGIVERVRARKPA